MPLVVVLLLLFLPSATLAAADTIANPFFTLDDRALTSFGSALEKLTRVPKEMTDVRCSGINSKASRGSGAAYYWCISVIQGTPNPLGLSYGIRDWDTWSRYMAEQYQVPTRLFDCFHSSEEFKIDPYPVPYERIDECLDSTQHTDDKGRVFKTISTQLASREPLSTFVKIDIEGMEWTVLEAMTDEDFSKIAILDLEVHFCLTMQTDTPAKILRVLRQLSRHFYVTGRLSEGDWLNGVGCDGTLGQTTMMSISYVNKAAMFGRIVQETTRVLLHGYVSKHACAGHDTNITIPSIQRTLTLCSGYLLNSNKWHRAETLSGLAVGRSDNTKAYLGHLREVYAIDGRDFACGEVTDNGSDICTGTNADEREQSLVGAVKAHLEAKSALSVALMLDARGMEWALLKTLSEEDLDKIMSLNIVMDFCSSRDSFQAISHVLRRLQQRFLVTNRGWNPGIRHRCGCLEGQQSEITVSYINKRGRTGKYRQFPQ